jgi:hypothetical protein
MLHRDLERKKDDLLHVDLLTYEASDIRRENTSSHIDPVGTTCVLLSHIAPKKLVLKAVNGEPLPIRSIDQRELEKIVSWVGWNPFYHRITPQQMPPFASSCAPFRTIVYLLEYRLSGYLQADAVMSFRNHIKDMVYGNAYASKIVFVNANFDLSGAAREISNERFATLKTEIETALAVERGIDTSFEATAADNETGGKSKPQAEMPTVKFLGMREYVEEYDTAGEFTDKERKLFIVESDRSSR